MADSPSAEPAHFAGTRKPCPELRRVRGGVMHVRTGGLPEDPVSFAEAMQVLATIMEGHYPELKARRALIEGAADELLTGYDRPQRAVHYEALPAWLWRRGEIIADGRGNYDLRCNFNGIPSVSCDIHFARADVERFRDHLIASRASPARRLAAAENAPASRPPINQKRSGKPSRSREFWSEARKFARKWLAEHGPPSPGDGGQARLEEAILDWLTARGHEASESTIRIHVQEWIKEYLKDPLSD